VPLPLKKPLARARFSNYQGEVHDRTVEQKLKYIPC